MADVAITSRRNRISAAHPAIARAAVKSASIVSKMFSLHGVIPIVFWRSALLQRQLPDHHHFDGVCPLTTANVGTETQKTKCGGRRATIHSNPGTERGAAQAASQHNQ
jgi:hypothetical protein